MKRYPALLGAAVLAVSSALGSASAQTGVPVNADGSYVVANDDGESTASGAGEDINYGDVMTGGARGETLGDPNAVYSPMVPDNPGPNGGVPVMPGSGDGLIGGVPIMPVPAAPGAAITTSPAGAEGTTTETTPVDAAAPADSAPVATDAVAADGGSVRNTPPGTMLRSPTKTSVRQRQTRRWCKRSTPTTMGSPARK